MSITGMDMDPYIAMMAGADNALEFVARVMGKI